MRSNEAPFGEVTCREFNVCTMCRAHFRPRSELSLRFCDQHSTQVSYTTEPQVKPFLTFLLVLSRERSICMDVFVIAMGHLGC